MTAPAFLVDLELYGNLSPARGGPEWNVETGFDVLPALRPRAARLRPVSGNVPGQPRPVNETTTAVAAEA